MRKENKHKIKSTTHIPNTEKAGIIDKRYRITLPLLATTMFILLTYMTAAAPYIASNNALGLTMGKTTTIDSKAAASPSHSTSSLSTNASPLPSKDVTIATHLRTKILTLFTQPVSVRITDKNGVQIGTSTSTSVAPLKEKIVYLTLPAVAANKLYKICVTNEKFGKDDCNEEINNNSQSGQIDVWMTVP